MSTRRPILMMLLLMAALGALISPHVVAQDAPQSTADLDFELLERLEFRPIGPAVMGGRIADIAAVDADTFYAGAATGNLWKTTNRGTTWEPLFEDEAFGSIGDVTVAPSNPNVLWIGTGEANNRQSSPWGGGVYRSTDGGRTWRHAGLTETRHIGRIVVHPTDPRTAWVAAVGNLWAASEERGVFRTRDAGATWEHVLYVDDNTGAIDLAADPGDPDTLIVAMYQRRRSACCFVGGGPGSGLYRTRDGGDNWVELTEGIPAGDKGRMAISFYHRDGSIVYALIEAEGDATGIYRSDDRGDSWEMMSDTNPRPMYFSQVRVDPNDPQRIYVLGVNLHVSDDGGRTFRSDGAPRVHLDHHAMWIDPDNSEHIVMGSDGGVSVTFDRAANWRMLDNLPIGQFYEIGVDLRDPYWVYGGLQDNGSWGGPSATLDTRGIRNADWFNVNGGDGFYMRVDPTDANVVYAESQGGNIVRMNLAAMERQTITPTERPDRARLAEWPADRMAAAAATEEGEAAEAEPEPYRANWNTPIIISQHDPATLYYGANRLMRSRDRGYTWEEVSPDLTRAIDRDEEELMGVKPVAGVLSRNDGISSYGNITTVAESPLDADLVYVGTDDGNVQRSADGGHNWTDLTETFPGLPDRTYVSRLVASASVVGRVYATFDNHYHGDFRPFAYRSDDGGDTWTPIMAGLPETSVNVIVEHPRTPDLVFLGNEVGLYLSIDAGETWQRLKNNLPTVPVDDLVIHPRTNDLVLGTHGRSIWILDDVTPLEYLAEFGRAAAPMVVSPRPVVARNLHSPQEWAGAAEFRAPNPPNGALLYYWVPAGWAPEVEDEAPAGDDAATAPPQGRGDRSADEAKPDEPTLTLRITDVDGEVVRDLEVPAAPGLNRFVWDLRTDPPYEAEPTARRGFFGSPPGMRVLEGDYSVAIVGRSDALAGFAVLADPRVQVSPEDQEARQRVLRAAFEFARPYNDANVAVGRLMEQLASATAQLREASNAPTDLVEQGNDLRALVREIQDDLRAQRRVLFAGFGVERASSPPTDDQVWQIEQARADLPPIIERLNKVIETGLPALYAAMNSAGVHPDPGTAVEVPDWRER